MSLATIAWKYIWGRWLASTLTGAALLLRRLEPEYPSPLVPCVVSSLFLQQAGAMEGESWASLRISSDDCVDTPVVRGSPSMHQNRH